MTIDMLDRISPRGHTNSITKSFWPILQLWPILLHQGILSHAAKSIWSKLVSHFSPSLIGKPAFQSNGRIFWISCKNDNAPWIQCRRFWAFWGTLMLLQKSWRSCRYWSLSNSTQLTPLPVCAPEKNNNKKNCIPGAAVDYSTHFLVPT